MKENNRDPAAARAMAISTGIILGGIGITTIALPSEPSVNVFAVAAIGVGASLTLGTCMEGSAGVRNVFRIDVLMLWVLYGLTFLEFLFPQPDLDATVSPASALTGTYAVFFGFLGISVGRHFVSRQRAFRQIDQLGHVSSTGIFVLLMMSAIFGYLHMFLAVNFDLLEMLRQMSLPRFSQSWGRSQYGDASALIYELQLLTYVIPPITGLVYARPQEYTVIQKVLATLVFVFTLYYGFSSGTRNVVATYFITFVGLYFLAKPKLKVGQVLLFGVPALLSLILVTTYMLEFRTVGLKSFSFSESRPDTLFIDYNIVNISQLTDLFPNIYGYLGLEIPFNALIRPIPRVIWPGKPDSLSVSIESALGVTSPGMTLSCTFVGEAYMAGGFVAVLIVSLVFGAAAQMWNRMRRHGAPPLTQLVYVSGFLCATIAMRSMLSMVPFMLPTLALWLFAKAWPNRSRPHAQPT